ncbi:MAG TPA: EAL domain-containing protein [Acidimicrobiales bacterium]|nr:EAL domain-containing protein [Acidimicrobiales bacterium]
MLKTETDIRVVVIDDHEMVLQSVVRLLEEDSQIIIVGSATTAAEGIDIVRAERPDVVIIDYVLPDMDAPEAIQQMLDLHPEVKIITFSGSGRPGALFASRRAGSSAWVQKTRAIQDLRDAVHHVAAGRPVGNEETKMLPTLDELVIHYQPIVEIEHENIVGFEALVRWQHPERGLLLPVAFLPLAVETGFIVDIDRWVWQHAALQLHTWQEKYVHGPRMWMSVNLSASDLLDPTLFDAIFQTVQEARIEPSDLVVEVTESVLLDDTAQSMEFLTRLRSLGVKLALDDFGTAFSSLSYVRRFPFDHLKLDLSFTADLPHSTRSMLLVEEICHLAASMDMTCIGEGVERVEQAKALYEVGCQLGQGYLFSRPLPIAECEELFIHGPMSAPS